MKRDLDSGFPKMGVQAPRKSARVRTAARVKLRQRGSENFTVQAFDLSPEGCKLQFLEPPHLDETVWVKFDGLELLEATVCWTDGLLVGVEFSRAIHPAVFDLLVSKLN
jgi:hypothetical protein